MPPAFGRSLTDLQVLTLTTPNRLYPGEERLLEATRRGEFCKLGDETSYTPKEKFIERNFVRASFIRFLALGGDANHPVHEKGVQLGYAFIGEDIAGGKGDLDLANCEHVLPLFLQHCRICGDIILKNAGTQTIDLGGSIVEGGIEARGAYIHGGLYLRSHFETGEAVFEVGKGFVAEGGMCLVDATIIGSLECHNATFGARKSQYGSVEATAILASRINVSGPVFLHGGFRADGSVAFRGAILGGHFSVLVVRLKGRRVLLALRLIAQARKLAEACTCGSWKSLFTLPERFALLMRWWPEVSNVMVRT